MINTFIRTTEAIMTVFINREQLHQQVWKMPMTKLAPIYGVKNYELKKICDRFLIPTPKSGYWSKLSFGKAEDITPLPRWKSCMLCHIQDKMKTLSTMMVPKKVDISAVIHKPIHVVELIPNKVNYGIMVKKSLSNLHPLIEQTERSLKKSKAGEHGRIYPGNEGIAIYVARNNVKRALLIMDSILKWFENRGDKVKRPYKDSSRIFLIVDGVDIEIELFEKSYVSGKITSHWGYEYNQYSPSGNITLKINAYTYGTQIRTNWSDGKTQKVENLLNSFIDSVFEIVAWNKREKERLERERLEREIRHNERLYNEQCRNYENKMIDNLIEESNNLSLSTKIREYIASVEKNAKLHYQDEKYPKELLAWLDWANIQANKIDPLKDKFPSYVSPFDLIDKSKIL